MLKHLLAVLAGMALAAPINAADVNAVQQTPRWGQSQGCLQLKFCDAEVDDGPCKTADGNDVYTYGLFNKSNLTWYADKSTGTYDCSIYSSVDGYTASSGSGVKIHTATYNLTPTTPIVSFSGLFGYLWVECDDVGTQATVTLLACPASQ